MSRKINGRAVLQAIGAAIGFWILMIGALSMFATPQQPKKLEVAHVSKQQSQVKGAATKIEVEEPKAVIEVKTVEETLAIPFQQTIQPDATLAAGKTVVAVAGVSGQKVLSYTVTYTDGVETQRVAAGERITKAPVTEVKKIGTKVAAAPKPQPVAQPKPQPSSCSPHYSGCVPIASDVDCAGGSGNGPAYVSGPVQIVGTDIYGLDSNNNGVGCE
jgi:hypothetical protein